MSRLILLLGVALVGGCGAADEAAVQEPETPAPSVDSATNVEAFGFDDAQQIIYLDTQASPGQQRQFGIGLGSITIRTLRVRDNKLTFHYTPEVEGGYTIYECTVPVSPTRVEFRINPDGTPGETSFDLEKCRIVRRGNQLMEPQ